MISGKRLNNENGHPSTALKLPLRDFMQVLVDGNEIHLTTFEDEGRGPFQYERTTVEAFSFLFSQRTGHKAGYR